jgi:hypothetical protein
MKKFIISAVIVTAVCLLGTQVSFAQDLGGALLNDAAGPAGAGYTATSLPAMIGLAIRAALGLLSTIFFFYTLYAGFLWMTAGGDDKKVGEAKNILKNAVGGLLILTSAYAISGFITSRISQISTGTITQGQPTVPSP